MSDRWIGLYLKDRKVLDWVPVSAVRGVAKGDAEITIDLLPGHETRLGHDRLIVSAATYSVEDICSAMQDGVATHVRVSEDYDEAPRAGTRGRAK